MDFHTGLVKQSFHHIFFNTITCAELLITAVREKYLKKKKKPVLTGSQEDITRVSTTSVWFLTKGLNNYSIASSYGARRS